MKDLIEIIDLGWKVTFEPNQELHRIEIRLSKGGRNFSFRHSLDSPMGDIIANMVTTALRPPRADSILANDQKGGMITP